MATEKATPTKELPAWIRCELCDDYLCTIHGTPDDPIHVSDCVCPEIDVWAKRRMNPYFEGGREWRKT